MGEKQSPVSIVFVFTSFILISLNFFLFLIYPFIHSFCFIISSSFHHLFNDSIFALLTPVLSAVYVYSCPDGSGATHSAPVKMRMLYSSAKGAAADLTKAYGVDVALKVKSDERRREREKEREYE